MKLSERRAMERERGSVGKDAFGHRPVPIVIIRKEFSCSGPYFLSCFQAGLDSLFRQRPKTEGIIRIAV